MALFTWKQRVSDANNCMVPSSTGTITAIAEQAVILLYEESKFQEAVVTPGWLFSPTLNPHSQEHSLVESMPSDDLYLS